MSNKPTYYLVDQGDFFAEAKVTEIAIGVAIEVGTEKKKQ